MAYQSVDSRKDEFRKYLDKTGVVTALTTGMLNYYYYYCYCMTFVVVGSTGKSV